MCLPSVPNNLNQLTTFYEISYEHLATPYRHTLTFSISYLSNINMVAVKTTEAGAAREPLKWGPGTLCGSNLRMKLLSSHYLFKKHRSCVKFTFSSRLHCCIKHSS